MDTDTKTISLLLTYSFSPTKGDTWLFKKRKRKTHCFVNGFCALLPVNTATAAFFIYE